jgi:protein-S-isoprenylcysteine O-methyltransferase Ste14
MLLLAFAAYLAVPLALLGPLAFALFVTRFQIIPEERVLAAKFGDVYDYLSTER